MTLKQGRPARGEWRQMPPFLGWRDVFFRLGGMCKSKELKTPSTTPPPRIHRLPPPSKSGRKTPSTTPRSNSRYFIDYPPSKSGRKTPSTTPLEFTGLHRLPPSRNRAGKLLQLPPSNFGIDGTSSSPTFKVWLRPCLHDPGGIDASALKGSRGGMHDLFGVACTTLALWHA